MKKSILMLILLFLSTSIMAATAIGTAFSYQGELLDNGSPANGDYTIRLQLFADGGTAVLGSVLFSPVNVSNGLFTIENVDFGDAVYADSIALFIEVAVEPITGGGLNVLSPRQKLNPVPIAVQAEFLAPNGANNGELLQFDGTNWVASSVALSPWSSNGSAIIYTTGKVGIGNNITNPLATLHVRAPASGQDALRVQVNSSTKFMVHENGGTSIGTSGAAPAAGLLVEGATTLNNNISQTGGFGIIKYAVNAWCSNGLNGTGGFATPSAISRYQSNVNGLNVSITDGLSGNSHVGECKISFPSDISDSYWVVSITGSNPELGAHCTKINATQLQCYGIRERTGDKRPVSFNLLLF